MAATKPAALALLEQAEDFYRAAESGVKAAKPLLLYYCFMNLGKAFVLTCRRRANVNDTQHGLSEKLDAAPNDHELVNAYLDAYQTSAAGPLPPAGERLNNFDELLQAIAGGGVAANPQRYDLTRLMPQIVPGHRLWVESDARINRERFVSIERIEFCSNAPTREIWLKLYFFADDLKRIGLGHLDLLSLSRLGTLFREVHCAETKEQRPLICFEMQNPVTYTHRAADTVPALVTSVRHLLWRTVLSTPPYRKYYVYPAPLQEHVQLLPQILSIYAITHYLGSIVRYRPHHFDAIIAGSYGPFIEAFLNDQPSQFIYLIASEFAEKEVTKAAIV